MTASVMREVPPATISCPNCHGQMTIVAITPLLFTTSQDTVIYRCKDCNSEIKRTFEHVDLSYFPKKHDYASARS